MASRPLRQFAIDTVVPVEQSRDQILDELTRLGAYGINFTEDIADSRMILTFQVKDQPYRIALQLPDLSDDKYGWTPSGRHTMSLRTRRAAWLLDCRPKWRQLYIFIKALRVAKESPLFPVEDLLLQFRVLPGGQTAAEWLALESPPATTGRSLSAGASASTQYDESYYRVHISPATAEDND